MSVFHAMIAIALWCGAPHDALGPGAVVGTTTKGVDHCRRQVMRCLESKTDDKSMADCFRLTELP